MRIIISCVAFLTIFCFNNVLKSQPPIGQVQVSTCFQTVGDVQGKTIKLLSSNGERSFTVQNAGGTGGPWGIQIMNISRSKYTLFPDLVLANEDVRHYISPTDFFIENAIFWEFPQEENGQVKFTLDNSHLGNIVNIRLIREYLYNDNGRPGRFLYFSEEFTVEFIDSDDVIVEIIPTNDETCLTFDNYSFDLNFPELEGLCFIPTYKLALKSTTHGYLGLPMDWESELIDPSFGWPSIPADCSYEPGDPHCAAQNGPDPVPCKCIEFDLEIELNSCDGNYIDCPPINLNKTIDICCECDVRPVTHD